MATERNIRTNFAFHPPEGDGGAWHATLVSLERALREGFPDPTIGHRRSGVHEMTVLDFEIELAPDVWLDGTAAITEPDYAYITLTDVTADEAGAFAVWLRDSFAPAPDLVRFVSSLAMANGEDTSSPLPVEGDREDIGALLRRHLDAFDY
ncbi:hypothetical protein [Streptomyces sp. WAC08241]|uniref:hypothetical protein n=1 Tax=Streptomyces sp. WAC08241 TaxID=2487421 RepID=UPI000F7A3B7D|nr:hypothetical protein [Streptomyces sp. WAC08241]RSS46549.1 hypothetical protein EF906_01975 [Streptomyces sp. WAC08241]